MGGRLQSAQAGGKGLTLLDTDPSDGPRIGEEQTIPPRFRNGATHVTVHTADERAVTRIRPVVTICPSQG